MFLLRCCVSTTTPNIIREILSEEHLLPLLVAFGLVSHRRNCFLIHILKRYSESKEYTLTFSFPSTPTSLSPSFSLLPLTCSLSLAHSLILQLYHTVSICHSHTHSLSSEHFFVLVPCLMYSFLPISSNTHTLGLRCTLITLLFFYPFLILHSVRGPV